MVEVIYSSDNLTVIGGPTALDLDLNVGATGSRGSLIFNDAGNPNLLSLESFPVAPSVFDIFINSDPGSDDYLQAYQYVNQDGSNVWVRIFKLTQNIIHLNKVVTFSAGQGTSEINLTELGLDTLPFDGRLNSFAYFNVQATITNVDVSLIGDEAAMIAANIPAAISVLALDVYDDTEQLEFPAILPLKFAAAEFNGTTWSPITEKDVMVHLSISFANPNEVLNFGGTA